MPLRDRRAPTFNDQGRRGAWPSWRWMMLSATPSRASSSACAWRRWCGANGRLTRARAASLILAAQAGVTIFHVAFAHWVEQDDPTAFRRLMDESLEDLRSVTAA
jgi:hypothetical protein